MDDGSAGARNLLVGVVAALVLVIGGLAWRARPAPAAPPVAAEPAGPSALDLAYADAFALCRTDPMAAGDRIVVLTSLGTPSPALGEDLAACAASLRRAGVALGIETP